MILRNIQKATMMKMYISTVRNIIFLISPITISLNRYAAAVTCIYSQAAVHMKTRMPMAGLPKYFTIKESGTSSISGDRNGHTTGIPGGLCFPTTWERDFDFYT